MKRIRGGVRLGKLKKRILFLVLFSIIIMGLFGFYYYSFERGKDYATMGHYTSKRDRYTAISHFSNVIMMNPFNEKAYLWRGSVYSTLGDYSNAISDLNKALEIGNYQTNVVGYQVRGHTYYRSGDYDKAISDYNTVLEIYPYKDSSDYYFTLRDRGDAYKKLGEYSLAENDYSLAEKIFAENNYSHKGGMPFPA